MVVIVANIRAAQNAPINAENIKRGSITRSSSLPRKPDDGRPALRSQSSIFRAGAVAGYKAGAEGEGE
jgi:hypothetical protein